MNTFKKLFLSILALSTLTACTPSRGEATYFRSADISDESTGRTVYLQGMMDNVDTENLPDNYAVVYKNTQEVEIYQSGELLQTVSYRPPKASEQSQIILERGPWSLTEYNIYWPNGEVKRKYSSSRDGLWIEKLYDATGALVEETKYRDGVATIDSYRGKGRIFDTKSINPKRINENGLEESITEYYDENGVTRIKEYWQANLEENSDGELEKFGETLRVRELYDHEGKLIAEWHGEGSPDNNPVSRSQFDRIHQATIDIAAADQYRGDEIDQEIAKEQEEKRQTITNEGSEQTESEEEQFESGETPEVSI